MSKAFVVEDKCATAVSVPCGNAHASPSVLTPSIIASDVKGSRLSAVAMAVAQTPTLASPRDIDAPDRPSNYTMSVALAPAATDATHHQPPNGSSSTPVVKPQTLLDGVSSSVPLYTLNSVAIVGLSFVLPGGVESSSALWSLLTGNRETRQMVPVGRWSPDYVQRPAVPDGSVAPGKTATPYAHFLTRSVSQFDERLFGISPREVPAIDPQQRLLLELAHRAFEDAGLPLNRVYGTRTGVAVGLMNPDYLALQSDRYTSMGPFSSTGLSFCIAANRISYVFDLRGPSVALDTACSSSAVCLHNAVHSLRRHETDMYLCGGVNMLLNPKVFVALSQLRLLSPDGRSKAFDATGDGYARAEGGGVLLLKRFADAMRDGDRIHALVCGTSINSDGRSSVPITSPNQASQESLLADAYAQFDPQLHVKEHVQYVEAHGTGTALGDATEVSALRDFFRSNTNGGTSGDVGDRKLLQPLVIGSVKANVGHLEPAAGVVGIIKVIHCLKKQMFVPTPHFQRFPIHIASATSGRVEVQTRVTEWPNNAAGSGLPRLAAVNSFGYGGTNGHVVLAEAPSLGASQRSAKSAAAIGTSSLLLPMTAHTASALDEYVNAHASALLKPEVATSASQLYDYLWTASCRRTLRSHRAVAIGSDAVALAAAIKGRGANYFALSPTATPVVVFVFGGQGTQWRGMLDALIQDPTGARHLQLIDDWCRRSHGFSVMDVVHASAPGAWTLMQSNVAVFAVEATLAVMYLSWGVQPRALIGHSLGEVVCAYVGGVVTLTEALELLTLVGAKCQQLVAAGLKGHMVEVDCPQQRIHDVLARFNGHRACAVPPAAPAAVYIASVNSQHSCTLSGTSDDIDGLLHFAPELSARRLPIDFPFHSPLVEPLRQELVPGVTSIFAESKSKHHDKGRSDSTIASLLAAVNRSALLCVGGGLTSCADVSNPTANPNLKHPLMRDGLFWWHNLRDTIAFDQTVRVLSQREHGQGATAGGPLMSQTGRMLFLELSANPGLLPHVKALWPTQDTRKTTATTDVEFVETLRHFAGRSSAASSLQQLHVAVAKLFVNGVDVHWYQLQLQHAVSERRINEHVPPLPLHTRPYWSEGLDSFRSRMGLHDAPGTGAICNGLLRPTPSRLAAARDMMLTRVYAGTIVLSEWPLFQQHVFSSRPLVPGSFWVELFLAVGADLGSSRVPFEVRRVRHEQPLWLSEKCDVRVEVRPMDVASFEVVVMRDTEQLQDTNRDNDHKQRVADGLALHDQPETVYSRAELAFVPTEPLPRAVTSTSAHRALLQSAGRAWSAREWYADFTAAGFEYGRCYQLLDHVTGSPMFAAGTARVMLPLDVLRDLQSRTYVLHPCVIDAVTQATAACTATGVTSSLPTSCERIVIGPTESFADLKGTDAGSEVHVDVENVTADGRLETADVHVYTVTGRHLASLLRVQSTNIGTPHPTTTGSYGQALCPLIRALACAVSCR